MTLTLVFIYFQLLLSTITVANIFHASLKSLTLALIFIPNEELYFQKL